MKVETKIVDAIAPICKPYLDNWHKHRIDINDGEVEVKGQVSESELTRVMMLRVIVNHDSKQIAIPNIFMVEAMRGKSIGKRIIAAIFEVASTSGYDLFVIDLTLGFYNRLIKRGALPCTDPEAVQIVATTRLN